MCLFPFLFVYHCELFCQFNCLYSWFTPFMPFYAQLMGKGIHLMGKFSKRKWNVAQKQRPIGLTWTNREAKLKLGFSRRSSSNKEFKIPTVTQKDLCRMAFCDVMMVCNDISLASSLSWTSFVHMWSSWIFCHDCPASLSSSVPWNMRKRHRP